MNLPDITDALSDHMPAVMRWAGAIAKQLRDFDISVVGKKTSGIASTDALTLADLAVQELLVAALRDGDPILRQCRLEAEESTGDLARFALEGTYTIALDPIDGTRQYRDHSGNGWSVMLNLRSHETVHYSLVFIPESGETGTWVHAVEDRIICGADDPSQPARTVLQTITPLDAATRPDSKRIYLTGFPDHDVSPLEAVNRVGLEGYTAEHSLGCVYECFVRGSLGGVLIHTPNVYDFPVILHLARLLGGDALWVHNREPVNFETLWVDERADMLRLPGIVACSANEETLATLCDLAKTWDATRYRA